MKESVRHDLPVVKGVVLLPNIRQNTRLSYRHHRGKCQKAAW